MNNLNKNASVRPHQNVKPPLQPNTRFPAPSSYPRFPSTSAIPGHHADKKPMTNIIENTNENKETSDSNKEAVTASHQINTDNDKWWLKYDEYLSKFLK